MKRGFRWVMAVAVVLVLAGSTGQAWASAFTFTVEFDGKGCPVAAPADAPNCEAPPVKRRDCVKVEQKKGHKVKIVAARPREIPFELTVTPAGLGFDPEGAAGKLKSKYNVRIEDARSGTTYKFSVSVAGCTPLDPTIIIK